MTTTTVTGILQSGGTSTHMGIADVLINVFQAGVEDPKPVGNTRSENDGAFLVNVTASAGGIFYAVADLGSGVILTTIIGPSLVTPITINELTTVAAAFCFAQFIHHGKIAGPELGLSIAAGMNNNLVTPTTGESPPILLSSPNGDETNSLRSTRSLANLLSVCVLRATTPNATGPDPIAALLEATTPPDSTRPSDTFQALVNLVLNPANNVPSIYAQSRNMEVELYRPALERMPDAWTLAVKINYTGGDVQFPQTYFSGPGNIAFDQNGYAWITNNTIQGTPTSNNNLIVLQPNGRPSDGTNGTPRSPLTGGGLKGGGFGVAIDVNRNVWAGNFGWGGDNPSEEPPGSGSVSEFSPSGASLSSNGYHHGTWRVQSVAVDAANNIWCASFGNNRVVVFPNGEPRNAFWFPTEGDGPNGPFGIAFDQYGAAWVTNSGGLSTTSPSSLSRYAISDGQLMPKLYKEFGHSLKGISIDSNGNIWVASGGDNAVYLLDPNGEFLGKFNGGGLNCPWSVTIDGDDHAWVANFGPMRPGMNFTSSSVTKLAGTKPATLPPKLKTGDPISPPTGYTLPSAGAEVLLPSGTPLYGSNGPKCFSPLMRLTNCCIDQAGNVWAINNWKPDFDLDKDNPGGDGIVIFVGLAKPPIEGAKLK